MMRAAQRLSAPSHYDCSIAGASIGRAAAGGGVVAGLGAARLRFWDDVGHVGPLSGSQIEFAHVNDHDECDDEDDHLHLSDLLCPLKHSCQQFIEPPLQPLGIACARRPVAENLGVLFQDIHAPRRVGHQRREELELQILLCPRERERGLAPILRLNGSEDLKGELEARAESADALGKLCEHEGCPSCA